MTASTLAADHQQCLAAGMDCLEIKPIAKDALFRLVEKLSTESAAAELPPELAGRPAFLAGLAEDQALARKLVDLFLQQSPILMTQLRLAIGEGDAPAIVRAAHALKGTISNFPAGRARSEAARMEAIGLAGDVAAAREALGLLDAEVERFCSLLPALIVGPGTPSA
jgi:HPt (histidine-containing phosphotransfer) domain-containing protein